MITILTWSSIIAGGLLVFLFLFSLIGGLDLDVDVDTDAGGLGLIKGVLTFVSVASWVMKILLVTNSHPGMAIAVGIISGLLAFLLLNYLFKILLQNEENVNWEMNDALLSTGEVYLRIPKGSGSGIVNANVRGAVRELKAKTKENIEIPTGAKVTIIGVEGDFVIVEQERN